MNRRNVLTMCGFAGVVALAGSLAFAQNAQPQPGKETKPTATKPAAPARTTPAAPANTAPTAAKNAAPGQAMPLPPGWTEADMQACIAAGTPGPNHLYLTNQAGVWTGKCTMWMAPGTEPSVSECTSTITPMMDGKFIKTEMAGSTPEMGPFSGFGVMGYDNVAQQFQCTWLSSCGTGMMVGTGELASEGTTITWHFTSHCPIAKKETTARAIEQVTGKDTKSFEMYGTDPKSGKEFKMMQIAFTRKPGSGPLASPGTTPANESRRH